MKFIEDVKKFMFLEDKAYRNQYKEEVYKKVRQEEIRLEAMYRI